MVVYSCKCLNVQVFGQAPQQKFDEESLGTCPLGASGKVIELIDPGFNFTHKCLVQRERNDQWTVYICVPCHMRTHAVNVKANLLVINRDMEVGDEAVSTLRNKPEYSKVFQLVLTNQGQDNQENEVVKRQSYEILQKQLGDLQAVLCRYLKVEEEQMERRVRQFEVEQRAAFDRLTQSVKTEKNKLVSVLFSNSERTDFTAVPEKSSQGRPVLSHSKSVIDYSSNNTAQQSSSHLSRERGPRRMRDSSPDVFAMEELEIDDNEEDCAGISFTSNSSRRAERSDRSRSPEQYGRQRSSRVGADLDEIEDVPDDMFSTSVPISMPVGSHFRSKSFRESVLEDDLECEAAEFADIPRQMQQLSESIQEGDRYIFGDRPRQRFNTGDFTQVRPKWK